MINQKNSTSSQSNNPVIQVNNLVKSYDGKKVVDNLSLTVNEGEIHGFLGPNGSGKTTTIRMICGLIIPDSGEGTCLGKNIKQESLHIKEKIGYMTQKFSLYEDLSVYENLNFVAQAYQVPNRKKKVLQTLDQLGIDKNKYKQLAKTLSGGWKQRLALAAAIIHDPKLLLLDEPTAGVDPKARREFWKQIHNLSAQGITTLVSTHYMDEAEQCHKIAYLAYGKLLVDGTIDDIIQKAELNTWEISNYPINPLIDYFEQQNNIEQIAIFGNMLHVSTKLNEDIEPILKKLPFEGMVHRKISTSLEDAFIHMMTIKKDQLNESNI